MAQKQLKELLKEDQEPFFLKDYIADRRDQMKRASTRTHHLQVKKRKPISANRNFPGKFCKNACFLSLNDSPNLRKSPLFEFPSPAKSPCKTPNAIFLHIPARTAALLLEAALRIQKQSSSSSSSKPKTQKQNHGFALFGSFLKRLTHRNWSNRTREIESSNGVVKGTSVVKEEEKTVSTYSHDDDRVMTACTGRPSSAIWSESNEEKSLDLETSSSSSQFPDSEELDFLTKLMREGSTADFAFCDHENNFCQSPFRFVLTRSPSSGHRTPEFSSPAASPSHHKQEDKKNYVSENSQVEEEEEEKEQFSPVSVLDPPFEDDYDGRDDEGFDMESSYASVQRTKQQLLQKLRRFEKLAKLDPIELEKRMLEDGDDDNYDINNLDEEEECEDDELSIDGFVREVLSKSSFRQVHRTPEHMKRLVSDLIFEEKREQNSIDNIEELARRVCKRFESWKDVQSNTIDMMIEQDFRSELEGWKNNKEQVGETAVEIEFAIFGLLVEELAAELGCLDGK
ncbi:histone-lysine N-methyltransferase SETD1B-like protein [Parasponia andersonii]|uniref:Histone-lysine N-methyltransferase SETD1B-like protein n=1 Tax=Parasponia andersonii TaxID=3476 RepID=A0A2P5A4E9_PARAD|nr:histone-lysine N-methyltransferase SETD1B-like protein [Parasponia andersonii]